MPKPRELQLNVIGSLGIHCALEGDEYELLGISV